MSVVRSNPCGTGLKVTVIGKWRGSFDANMYFAERNDLESRGPVEANRVVVRFSFNDQPGVLHLDPADERGAYASVTKLQ